MTDTSMAETAVRNLNVAKDLLAQGEVAGAHAAAQIASAQATLALFEQQRAANALAITQLSAERMSLEDLAEVMRDIARQIFPELNEDDEEDDDES